MLVDTADLRNFKHFENTRVAGSLFRLLSSSESILVGLEAAVVWRCCTLVNNPQRIHRCLYQKLIMADYQNSSLELLKPLQSRCSKWRLTTAYTYMFSWIMLLKTWAGFAAREYLDIGSTLVEGYFASRRCCFTGSQALNFLSGIRLGTLRMSSEFQRSWSQRCCLKSD